MVSVQQMNPLFVEKHRDNLSYGRSNSRVESYDDPRSTSTETSQGPEFVRNAFTPPKVIDLTDSKVSLELRVQTSRFTTFTIFHRLNTVEQLRFFS